jgi:hypothetical protein
MCVIMCNTDNLLATHLLYPCFVIQVWRFLRMSKSALRHLTTCNSHLQSSQVNPHPVLSYMHPVTYFICFMIVFSIIKRTGDERSSHPPPPRLPSSHSTRDCEIWASLFVHEYHDSPAFCEKVMFTFRGTCHIRIGAHLTWKALHDMRRQTCFNFDRA